MARVHLIVGPVGAGKSTLARRLCDEHRAVALNLDEWMATLFAPDRPPGDLVPWYRERAERCVDQIWRTAQGILATDRDVVLEVGLLQRLERGAFMARVESSGHPLIVYVVDAPREVRKRRVLARNRARGPTFTSVVPPEVFELASDMWQPPTDRETRAREVHFIDGERSTVSAAPPPGETS